MSRTPDSLVDLDRYPIRDLQAAQAQAAIARGRAALAADGLALFPGFVPAEALASMAAKAEALVPLSLRGIDLQMNGWG